MPRKGGVRRREILPDPKFHDRQVAKFINAMMECGKKSVAERLFYRALDVVGERAKEDPLGVFRRAVENGRPVVEVRSRRVGGATYQVPMEVRAVRRTSLAMRWIIQSSRGRAEKTMSDRLAAELLEAAASRGTAVKKKEDTHCMAEANKAFAHYRW